MARAPLAGSSMRHCPHGQPLPRGFSIAASSGHGGSSSQPALPAGKSLSPPQGPLFRPVLHDAFAELTVRASALCSAPHTVPPASALATRTWLERCVKSFTHTLCRNRSPRCSDAPAPPACPDRLTMPCFAAACPGRCGRGRQGRVLPGGEPAEAAACHVHGPGADAGGAHVPPGVPR